MKVKKDMFIELRSWLEDLKGDSNSTSKPKVKVAKAEFQKPLKEDQI